MSERASFVPGLALLAHGSWGRVTRQQMWPSARVPRDVARRRGLSWSCRTQGNTSLGSVQGRGGVQPARKWRAGPFCRLLDIRRLWRLDGLFPVLDAQASTRHVADTVLYRKHVGVLAGQRSQFKVRLRCQVRDALILPSPSTSQHCPSTEIASKDERPDRFS